MVLRTKYKKNSQFIRVALYISIFGYLHVFFQIETITVHIYQLTLRSFFHPITTFLCFFTIFTCYPLYHIYMLHILLFYHIPTLWTKELM